MPMLGAANRDESATRIPDRFDIFRAPKPAHLVGTRRPRLPRDAPGAARDARRARAPVRPPARSAPRSRGQGSAHPRAGVPVAHVAARPVLKGRSPHVALRCVPVRRQAGSRRGWGHRHGRGCGRDTLEAGAEVVVMDHAKVTLPGVKAIKLDLRTRPASTPRSTSAAARSTRCSRARRGRRNAGHREDQLHRSPAPHRSHARRGHAAARLGDRHDLVGGGPGVGVQPAVAQGAPGDSRLRLGRGVDRRHRKADYMWSKKAINTYVASEAFPLLKRGVRINAISRAPPTRRSRGRTPTCGWVRHRLPRRRGGRGVDARAAGLPAACSCAAMPRLPHGPDDHADAGYMASGITGSFPNATMMAKVLMGREAEPGPTSGAGSAGQVVQAADDEASRRRRARSGPPAEGRRAARAAARS